MTDPAPVPSAPTAAHDGPVVVEIAPRPLPERSPLWRWSDLAVLPLLLVLGAALGVWSALLAPTGPRVAGHLLSVGVLVAVVGNVVAVRLAMRASRPFGSIAVLVGWTVVVFLATTRRPNGSVLLIGSGELGVISLLVFFGGLVGGLAAAVIKAPR